MDINPTGSYTVDFFAHADFSGFWKSKNNQDLVCVKSTTEFVMMLMGYPLTWISKLQTQITLSNIESKHIALSHSMRELVGIR